MDIVIIILLSLSVLCFILSIVKQKQDVKQDQSVEQHTLQLMGDVYTLQTKVERLEEELLVTSTQEDKKASSLHQLKKTIAEKITNGHSVLEISKQLQLSEDEVLHLLPSSLKGS
ncbi:hypothetical protein DH09_07585 [Bacillaceae bacterium JMAK1]|nr:hypothetical protein DH09_07585 [Bacillaceae bacterium JMAK1]